MKTGFKARQITLLGLLTAILLLMSYTPLGYLRIGPLSLTLNMVPVAVAAAVLGPVGGGFTGAVFGLTSFFQCLGFGGASPLGVVLFQLSPLRCFLMCFGARLLTGVLVGVICRWIQPRIRSAAAVTGFLAAFFNTVCFMASLLLLFGRTRYVQNMMSGQNIFVFICTFVGLQAVFEMLASTFLTTVLVKGLEKAKLLER